DDHRLDVAQHLACFRGEDQIQRLWRRDQDVRWLARHRRALLLRRLARANADAPLLRADSAQWRPQVALDVVRERLQRADVDDTCPRGTLYSAVGRARRYSAVLGPQPAQRPKER